MAILNKVNANNEIQHFSDSGNAAKAICTVTLASAQIGDVVYLGKLPGGTKITGVQVNHAAMGAGVTLATGYLPVTETGGNASYFLAAAAASSLGVRRSDAFVLTITQDTYITFTVAGGVATGAVEAIIDYVYLGQ